MRGKLRDKHIKYDSFKREAMERNEMQEQEGDTGDEAADQMLIRITKLTQK